MMRQWLGSSIGILGSTCLAVSALAQSSNFGTLTLETASASGLMTGSTGGSTSLPAIVSNRDRAGNACLGFGDPTPDHLLVLRETMPKLRLLVRSKAGNTTLVVKGPDGVRCGTPKADGKDASLTGENWPAGQYQVWVGSTTARTPKDYMLTARP